MNLKYKSLIVLIILAILYFLINFLENKEVFKILKSKISFSKKNSRRKRLLEKSCFKIG